MPGGLRMAWVLEPRADKYHRSSALKSRVILHNSGDKPVMFVTRSFHQPQHKAVTANGSRVLIESTSWTTIGRPEPYRLHPGEYCEVDAPSIGIGPQNKELEDWSNVRAGSWIFAEESDESIFRPGEILLTGDHAENVDPELRCRSHSGMPPGARPLRTVCESPGCSSLRRNRMRSVLC